MADMIAKTATGLDAIAYVGQTPWHSKGQPMIPGAPKEVWKRDAGFDFDVIKTPVIFNAYADKPEGFSTGKLYDTMPSRHVLFRDDTRKPLSVVSSGYKVVQPSEVLDFFEQFVEVGGMQLETAGVLDEGRKLWALAKLSDGLTVAPGDALKPYLLLYTSYDGKFATTARLTAIRVVCWNTLSAAHNAVGASVKVPHTQDFNKGLVADQLGIMPEIFFEWSQKLKEMAETPLWEDDANDFVIQLLTPLSKPDQRAPELITELSGYKKIMSMFETGAGLIGSDLDGGHTKWRMLNVVTQLVDHEMGNNRTRLNSAWFGRGDSIKNRAFDLLSA